jgi:hypothetical protein
MGTRPTVLPSGERRGQPREAVEQGVVEGELGRGVAGRHQPVPDVLHEHGRLAVDHRDVQHGVRDRGLGAPSSAA